MSADEELEYDLLFGQVNEAQVTSPSDREGTRDTAEGSTSHPDLDPTLLATFAPPKDIDPGVQTLAESPAKSPPSSLDSVPPATLPASGASSANASPTEKIHVSLSSNMKRDSPTQDSKTAQSSIDENGGIPSSTHNSETALSFVDKPSSPAEFSVESAEEKSFDPNCCCAVCGRLLSTCYCQYLIQPNWCTSPATTLSSADSLSSIDAAI